MGLFDFRYGALSPRAVRTTSPAAPQSKANPVVAVNPSPVNNINAFRLPDNVGAGDLPSRIRLKVVGASASGYSSGKTIILFDCFKQVMTLKGWGTTNQLWMGDTSKTANFIALGAMNDVDVIQKTLSVRDVVFGGMRVEASAESVFSTISVDYAKADLDGQLATRPMYLADALNGNQYTRTIQFYKGNFTINENRGIIISNLADAAWLVFDFYFATDFNRA